MKTDAKTMAEVLRKIADNLESGLDKNDSIQAMYGDNEWEDRATNDLCFVEDVLYRIKPKTITVNGVEIPKPLSRCEFSDVDTVFLIGDIDDLYFEVLGLYVTNNGGRFIYKTKEEAIEASKKLFGIE